MIFSKDKEPMKRVWTRSKREKDALQKGSSDELFTRRSKGKWRKEKGNPNWRIKGEYGFS